MKHTSSRNEMDMCSGSLWSKILFFSIPLMFSNVLQVLFNMSDIAVVGKFAGPIELGAVGSTTILITLTTGLLIGISAGVNAMTALYAGAQDKENLSGTVHTSILLCFAAGVIVLLFGIFFSESVLVLMNTKEELIGSASVYLKIYLCGSPALALYNYGNAILSAIGDTRRPLIYLSAAGILNVILNLVFVIFFHMGAAGVGLASILSQYLSAVLILRALLKEKSCFALCPSKIRFDRTIAVRVLKIGIPSAIQYALFAVANLFVQTAVNSFDHVAVEGNSAAANADALVYDMMAAFYTACTSFIAQNLGAGKKDRIFRTYLITSLYPFLLALILGVSLFLFRIPFLSLFTSDPDVIKAGVVRLSIMALSYCVSAFMDNATAASRGLGKTVIPTIIVILGSVFFRIFWILTVFAAFHTIESLYLLYVFSWIITAILGNIYFLINYRKLQFSAPKIQETR